MAVGYAIKNNKDGRLFGPDPHVQPVSDRVWGGEPIIFRSKGEATRLLGFLKRNYPPGRFMDMGVEEVHQ